MTHPPKIHPPRAGIRISAKVGLLAGRMVTTASATYARLGLGSIEAKVMLLLDGGGALKTTRICELVGVDRSAVSRTLKALANRGLIARAAGRDAHLSLTLAGLELCVGVQAVAVAREQRLFDGFSEPELEQLLDYLQRLSANSAALSQLTEQLQAYLLRATRRPTAVTA